MRDSITRPLQRLRQGCRRLVCRWEEVGIVWKVFTYLLGFVAILLVMLWFFQTVYLESFYRSIKVRGIKNTATTLAENIDNENFESLLDQVVASDNISVRIVSSEGEELYRRDQMRDSLIGHLSQEELVEYFQRALSDPSLSLEEFILEEKKFAPMELQRLEKAKLAEDGSVLSRLVEFHPSPVVSETLVYTKLGQRQDGTQVMVLVSSKITPVNATVETLRVQLVYISLIMLVLALGLAMLLSRKLSRPIVKINLSAKELAKGNYGVVFEGKGYREIGELNDTLNYATRELTKVEGLRQELISNISHDLRTPLTMITGYAEVMRDLPGENTPENVQIIIDEAKRLSTLVTDILDLSQLQSGSQSFQPADLCLTDTIQSILDRYSKLTQQDGYRITFQQDQRVWVQADEVKLGQVIYNLVNNAINYAGEDRRVTIRQLVNGGWVRVEISDNGEGIPQDKLPLIWDRYYKVDKNHRRAVVGTGLGLSIVKGVLELHKARYGVESREGEGSTFWFELPVSSES